MTELKSKTEDLTFYAQEAKKISGAILTLIDSCKLEKIVSLHALSSVYHTLLLAGGITPDQYKDIQEEQRREYQCIYSELMQRKKKTERINSEK